MSYTTMDPDPDSPLDLSKCWTLLLDLVKTPYLSTANHDYIYKSSSEGSNQDRPQSNTVFSALVLWAARSSSLPSSTRQAMQPLADLVRSKKKRHAWSYVPEDLKREFRKLAERIKTYNGRMEKPQQSIALQVHQTSGLVQASPLPTPHQPSFTVQSSRRRGLPLHDYPGPSAGGSSGSSAYTSPGPVVGTRYGQPLQGQRAQYPDPEAVGHSRSSMQPYAPSSSSGSHRGQPLQVQRGQVPWVASGSNSPAQYSFSPQQQNGQTGMADGGGIGNGQGGFVQAGAQQNFVAGSGYPVQGHSSAVQGPHHHVGIQGGLIGNHPNQGYDNGNTSVNGYNIGTATSPASIPHNQQAWAGSSVSQGPYGQNPNLPYGADGYQPTPQHFANTTNVLPTSGFNGYPVGTTFTSGGSTQFDYSQTGYNAPY